MHFLRISLQLTYLLAACHSLFSMLLPKNANSSIRYPLTLYALATDSWSTYAVQYRAYIAALRRWHFLAELPPLSGWRAAPLATSKASRHTPVKPTSPTHGVQRGTIVKAQLLLGKGTVGARSRMWQQPERRGASYDRLDIQLPPSARHSDKPPNARHTVLALQSLDHFG